MPEIRSKEPRLSTRDSITEMADALFYEHGFEATSFADIAGVVGVSRGNFYYHFKTKDEILDAVIARRMGSTRDMLAQWEALSPSPEGRLKCFIQILVTNGPKIMAHGCPVGSLCGELVKLDHQHLGKVAGIFTLFRQWLSRQFTLLGHGEQADMLAMHLLMRSQGIATLAAAYQDSGFVDREVAGTEAWIDELVADARNPKE